MVCLHKGGEAYDRNAIIYKNNIYFILFINRSNYHSFCLDYSIDNRIVKVKWKKDFVDDPYVIYLRNELGENLKSITGTAQYEVNKLSAELGNADVELVRKELGTEFDMIVHEPDGILEIGQAGHSKASGIERLCASLGIAKEDTYAFGDSANDVEMLEFVAHGIAMGNGTDVAKNAAEFVTTDIHKDGIWNGLKHYGLI